eukprot:935439_1
MATYYTNDYMTPSALIVNQPIYSTPCRYYGTFSGCMYGNSCPFQHIDYTYSPQINNPINNILHHNTSQIFSNNSLSISLTTTPSNDSLISYDLSISPSPSPSPISLLINDQLDSPLDIDTKSENSINIKQENAKKIAESVATTWDGCVKTIGYGSRKNMTIQKFESYIGGNTCIPCNNSTDNNNLALLVSNCSDMKLNGLYLISGYRNGYIKYTECINNLSTIYCNPKRGWTISHNNGVYYYSYPLTDTPPTINNNNSNWLCNFGSENVNNLPLIKSSSIIGHCFLDLLFVGFVRSNNKLCV